MPTPTAVSSNAASTSSNRAKSPRLYFLDALRGFAALYVVIHHISRIPKPQLETSGLIHWLVSNGGSGVLLFFVISGFSMCLTWSHHSTSPTPFRSFYTSRFIRIAPLFYIWLIVSLLRDFLFKGQTGIHSVFEISSNIFFIFNFIDKFKFGIVWASWTIGVEMLFYFLYPLLEKYLSTKFFIMGSLFIAVVTSVVFLQDNYVIFFNFGIMSTLFTSIGFFVCFPVFLIGVMVYRLYEKLQSETFNRWRITIGRVSVCCSLCGITLIPDSTNLIWYYLLSTLYGLLLFGFSLVGENIFVTPITKSIGMVSYSLYLTHPSLVYILAPIYTLIYKFIPVTGLNFLMCVTLTLIFLLPISYLSYNYIEKPTMLWGKVYLSRFQK